jgi:hypothetical protein
VVCTVYWASKEGIAAIDTIQEVKFLGW